MAVILPIISEFTSKGVDQAQTSLKKLAKTQLATAVSAGTLLQIARTSVTAYMDDAKAQRLLANTLRNTIGASDLLVSSVENQIAKLQDSSLVLDDELRPAMQQLVGITGSTTEAFDLLQKAIDISAYSGRDLGSTVDVLSKAYQGQLKGLRGLGLRISDTTMKSKDFQAAMEEIAPVVDGANAAINAGVDGSWKRLGVVAANLSETFGGSIVNNIDGFANALSMAAAEGGKAADEQGFFGKALSFSGDAIKNKLIGPLGAINKLLRNVGDSADAAAGSMQALGDVQRMHAFEAQMNAKWASIKAEADKKAADAAAKAAKANKARLADAVKSAKEELRALREVAAAYKASIVDAVNGTASLADAVSTAQSGEDDYTAAIRERADAYAELNAVQAKGVDVRTGSRTAEDAKDYADAIERVAKAETAVTNAQTARKDYTTIFRDQITAAKEFAGNLQQLVGKGLQDIGLQQLLNLGPVAGNQVAKDMLAGTAGLTVSDLNLTDLQAAATGLGGAAAGSMYGAQIAAAQTTVGQVQQAQTFNITVTSADPDKVVAALVAWSKKNGKLPSTVKVS